MTFKEFYLNEMFVIGKPVNNAIIVAFDKWIWILQEDGDLQNKIDDIISKLPNGSMFEGNKQLSTFISTLSFHYKDVLVGQIQGKSLKIINGFDTKLDPKSSNIVKKVIDQLGLTSVNYTKDRYNKSSYIQKDEIKNIIPDIAYHGTTTKYLDNILKFGIRPNESKTNYKGVQHENLIFFSTRIEEAMSHAVNASDKKGGYPVIIEFRISDKDLIIADFDAESDTGNNKYYPQFKKTDYSLVRNKRMIDDPLKFSKEIGVYGYKGNIKPNNFIYLYINDDPDIGNDLKKYKKISINDYKEKVFTEQRECWGSLDAGILPFCKITNRSSSFKRI